MLICSVVMEYVSLAKEMSDGLLPRSSFGWGNAIFVCFCVFVFRCESYERKVGC